MKRASITQAEITRRVKAVKAVAGWERAEVLFRDAPGGVVEMTIREARKVQEANLPLEDRELEEFRREHGYS